MDASDVAQMQSDVRTQAYCFVSDVLSFYANRAILWYTTVYITFPQKTLKVVEFALAQSESELLKIVPSTSSMW